MIKQTMESVLRENQRLHLKVEQSDAADSPYNMTEWFESLPPSEQFVCVCVDYVNVNMSHRRQLQEQCKLVLEENQLLMEQLEMQQSRARDMHRAHVAEGA